MDKLITDEQLQQAAAEGMDAFLKVFADAYLRRVDAGLMNLLIRIVNLTQHITLLHILSGCKRGVGAQSTNI